MMTVGLKEIILYELKQQNIKLYDILMLKSITSISDETFSPKICANFEMIDGSENIVELNLNRNQIQDLHYYGIQVGDDIEDLNKYFKRQISLKALLGYEK